MNKEILSLPKLQHELIIPEYPMRVQLSKSRRAKYYSNTSGPQRVTKIPKKYLNYSFNSSGFLIDKQGEKIIANSRSVGTPKFIPINGQVFYSQKGGEFMRAKVVNFLHEFFTEQIENQKLEPITQKPIIIVLNWHLPYNYQTPDNTNISYVYLKTFEDALVNYEILPDDEVSFVTGSFSYYTPVETLEERKLVFNFYHDNRDEIKQFKLFNE
jgi:hypothetical protein